jgi:hypothetical protein
MSDRFCRDCRHAERMNDGRTLMIAGDCLHPKNRYEPSSVTGDQDPKPRFSMFQMRAVEYFAAPCGPEGAWWEPLFYSPAAQQEWLKENAG